MIRHLCKAPVPGNIPLSSQPGEFTGTSSPDMRCDDSLTQRHKALPLTKVSMRSQMF